MSDSLRAVILEMVRSIASECIHELRAELLQLGVGSGAHQTNAAGLIAQASQSTARSSSAGIVQTTELNATAQTFLLEKFVSAKAREGFNQILISPQCVVTPVARDRIRELGITLVRKSP